MAPTTINQKLKKFPEPIIISESEEEGSDTVENDLGDELGGSDSDDMSDDESELDDAPEAESLRGGKAAADARDDALKQHEQRLNELRKTKNKAREAFIQSTKSEVPTSVESRVDPATDSARDMEEDKPVEEASRSNRLPDSIFAAAHETVERKSSKKLSKNNAPPKRKRVRQTPKEKVIDGRTLRVTMDLDAPPAASSSSSTRKVKNSTKGGLAFRKKWKKVDALRAQVRSRTGPPRNFVTVVQ